MKGAERYYNWSIIYLNPKITQKNGYKNMKNFRNRVTITKIVFKVQ